MRLGNKAGAAVTTMYRNAEDWQQIKQAYGPTIDPFVAASGTLTAQWYDELDSEAAFATEVAPAPAAEVFEASAGWAFSQADPLGALVRTSERQIFTASRDTVVHNARREGIKFARYASANACEWCQVLATRDAVYYSEESAIAGHDNCHCMAVPIRSGDEWNPPDYVQQWTDNYNAARDEVGGNINDIVNYMRRNN